MKVKKFSFYIKESLEIDNDMFQEFIDLGYEIDIKTVYAKTVSSFRDGNTYDEPGKYSNEIKGTKISIKQGQNESDISLDTMSIAKYIDHLKDLTQVFEILESRLESEIIIDHNPNMDLYLVDKVEELDNTEILNDLRQIKDYLDKKFQKSTYRYEVILNEEDMEISIMNVYDNASNIQRIFKTKEFKNLNPTAEKIVFEKRRYSHQEEGVNYSTLRFKLVSKIINN